MKVPFSPPDITQAEIDAVAEVLRSGWITTGAKTGEFEQGIAAYCGAERAKCLSSATAGMELVLRLLGIGAGDEVITTPYTFAATANVILHVGAVPVFADVKPGEFNIDPEAVERAITPRTKAVMPVDVGGWPVDYEEIGQVLENHKRQYNPRRGTPQEKWDRPVIVADSAHGFGSVYRGRRLGGIADFTVFSFHAAKNLTTAEGGAVTFSSFGEWEASDIYRELSLLALHGQSKDAWSKAQAGGWRYDIEIAGYKYNMTDIAAALGLSQLKRYDKGILSARHRLLEIYRQNLQDRPDILLLAAKDGGKESSGHLCLVRIEGADEKQRDGWIQKMAENGIACNVHYIPLPMHPLYRKLGYRMEDYPQAYDMFRNEITLPLFSTMTREQVDYVTEELKCHVVKKLPI